MDKKSGYYITFWQYLIISLMFVWFFEIDSVSVIFDNLWQLLMIGVFCTGIAFILFMEGVQKVKAQKIFIITALEPLAGTVLALILLAEIPPSPSVPTRPHWRYPPRRPQTNELFATQIPPSGTAAASRLYCS